MRGAAGEAEFAVEEVKEAREAEPQPQALAIEVGQGDQEVGQRAVFPAEEVGEAEGEFAGGGGVRVVHGRIVSCVFGAAWNARRRPPWRDRGAGVGGGAEERARETAGSWGRERGVPGGTVAADPEWREIVSMDSG